MNILLQSCLLLVGLGLPALAVLPWLRWMTGGTAPGLARWAAFPLGWGLLAMGLFLANLGLGLPIGWTTGMGVLLVLFLAGFGLRRLFVKDRHAGDGDAPVPLVHPPSWISAPENHRALGMPGWLAPTWITAALLVAVGAWAGMMMSATLSRATDDIPAMGAWGYKAMVLFREKDLPTELFLDDTRPYLHQSYPLSYPLIQAWSHAWMGGFNDHLIRLVPLAALGLLLGGLLAALRREGGSADAGLVAVLGLGTGALGWGTLAMYAEPILLLALLPGVFCWRRYLREDDWSAFRLGAWLLAAGAWVKNEGLAVFALAWLLMTILRWRAWRRQGKLADAACQCLLPAACFIMPWLAFRLALGLAEYDFRCPWPTWDVAGMTARLPIIGKKLVETLWLHPKWHNGVWWLLPLLACGKAKDWWRSPAERFTLGMLVGTLALFAGILVFSTRELAWHAGSLPRILIFPMSLAWVMVASALVRTPAADERADACARDARGKCWNRKLAAGAAVALAAGATMGSEPSSPPRSLSLREMELDTGVVVEITTAVKIDNDTLHVTLVNGREGNVHRHKLSEREEKRRFGTVVPRVEEGETPTDAKDEDGSPVEIALLNGKTISVIRAIRLDDNLLAVKLADGKTGKMRREQLSERDQLRCFGPPSPPRRDTGEVKTIPSGLPPGFDPGQFVASLTVKPEHLRTGSFRTPFYTMPFRYFVPEGLPTGIRVPVVVFLHGICEGGTDNLKQLLHRQPLIFVQPWMQDKYPCFFVAPQLNEDGPWCGSSGGNPMNATEELQVVVAIIDELQARFPAIDPDRIYLTGLSSGGLGVFEALAKYPGKFAGGVPVSAGYFRFAQEYFRPQRVAAWAFLNPDERPSLREDCRVSLENIAAHGGTARETSFSAQRAGGHLAWFWAYAEPDLIPWLFAQRRQVPE